MTRLYFHAATNSITGLPTVEQSSLTVDENGDSASTNRLMDTTKGTSQASINCTTQASTSAQVAHFTRFVTKPFANTSIAANTWNFSFAVAQDNVNANFPVSGSSKNSWVSLYVWNPNTTSKVGDIIDGVTANGDWDEPTVAASEIVLYVTFTGAAVNSIPSGCVLVLECMFQITHNNATSRTITFYYDGSIVDVTSADTATSMASFIETPQTLTFQTNAVKAITSTVTIGAVAPTRRKSAIKAIPTTVTISSPAPTHLMAKKRAITTETVTIVSTPAQILSHHKNVAPPAETITISTPSLTQLRSRVRVIVTTITILSTVTYRQVPNRPVRRLTETIVINSILTRKNAKKRSLLN